MKKILFYLINPYVLSAIITLTLILTLPSYFTKYKVDLIKQETLPRPGSGIFYSDLNNDNINEKITPFYNISNHPGYLIFNDKDEVLGQWNFKGKYPRNSARLYFEDLNENGFNEIYLFSIQNDSLKLDIVEPLLNNGINRRGIFIDTIGNHEGVYDSGVSNISVIKNENGNQEIYFSVLAGFEQFPRNIYKYNFNKNQVYKSRHLTNYQTIYEVYKSENSSQKKLFLSAFAAGNKIDRLHTIKTDENCWLTILNENLEFVIEQKEYRKPFYVIIPIPFNKNGEEFILCIANSSDDEKVKDRLDLLNTKGELIRSVNLPPGEYRQLRVNLNNEIVLNCRKSSTIQFYDADLNFIREQKLNHNGNNYPLDLDGDGIDEWINTASSLRSFTIYRNDFSHPIDVEIKSNHSSFIYFGIQQRLKKSTNFYVNKNEDVFIFNYSKNNLYYLKYLSYLVIYLIIYLLFLLIIKWQKIKTQKQNLIEKEIIQLQLKTIKNQVDPHFVFNSINTISSLRLSNDKIEEDNFICNFSELMRLTLNSSDSITCTLKEELDFINSYIKLQLIRLQNCFEYQLTIQKDINTNILIPKHIIYSHIENAIKHGLSINKKGFLNINILKNSRGIVVEIENSGTGLNGNFNEKISTGNGLKILEKIYKLYLKLYNKKISHTITELKDESEAVIGVKVSVYISNK